MDSDSDSFVSEASGDRPTRAQGLADKDKTPAEKLKIWEEGLKELASITKSEWLTQLEGLSSSVANEMDRLRNLRERLINLPDHVSDPSIHIMSTTELVRAKWSAIPQVLEVAHPTLYILVGPAGSNAIQEDRADGEAKSKVETPDHLPTGRMELPELIVIRSMRLLTYIEFNIHDRSIPWADDNGDVRYTLMRPFKMLVTLDEKIRNHLTDLERQRQDRFHMTEDEYDADWKANPPLDTGIDGSAIDISKETSSDLTGLIKDMRTLVRFMDHYIKPALNRSLDDPIYFSDLWNTFPTGTLIYVKDKKIHQKIWRVIRRTGGRFPNTSKGPPSRHPSADTAVPIASRPSPFWINCYSIDFDGTNYVHMYRTVSIDPFSGMELVRNLPALPLEAAETAGYIDIEAALDTARSFIACTRPVHRDYTGRSQVPIPNMQVDRVDFGLPENASQYSEWIDSEVMVDIERAIHAVPSWRPGLGEPVLSSPREETELDRYYSVDQDLVWERRTSDAFFRTQSEKCQKFDRENPPTEREDLLLLPGRVFAFVFRTRKWACLPLGKGSDGQPLLRRRKPRPDPWNDLELPLGHKALVQSLIESRLEGNTSGKLHFDLVRAKGKGIIILLHGVPGVGKTSTAECAAEANGRPLLPITCGDLGTSAREVESKLQEAFQLAQLWNCVLLLDEADVFLAQRSEDDIQRNALVSVFLRVLEYYEGILFLTSNRVGVFDEALKSRLHMALYYPPLELKYTKRIWETHLHKLTKSGLIEVDQKEIMDYAENLFGEQQDTESHIGPVWNGRQIRNAFQSAVALAGYKHQGNRKILLDSGHFEKVSNVSNQFNHYLHSIKSRTDADNAAYWGIRHDNWVKPGTTRANIRDQQSAGGNTATLNQDGLLQYGVNSAAGATAPSYTQQMIPPATQALQPTQMFQTQQQQPQQQQQQQPQQQQQQQPQQQQQQPQLPQQFSNTGQGFMQTHGSFYGTPPQSQTQIGSQHMFPQSQPRQMGEQGQFYSLQPQLSSSQTLVPAQQQQNQNQNQTQTQIQNQNQSLQPPQMPHQPQQPPPPPQ